MKHIVIASLTTIMLLSGRPAICQNSDERASIRRVALDYIEGWYEANAERMDRALHPELAKRVIFPAGGKERFVNLTKTQMVEATRKGGGKMRSADTRNIKVEILDVYRDIASVRTECADYVDYLHLAKSEDQWKIVNVLWQNYVQERKEVAIDPKILPNYAGEYELQPGFVIMVSSENNRLFVQGTGEPKVEAFASSETDFFLKRVQAQITFVRNSEGKVVQLVLHQAGADMMAKKIK